MKPDMKSIDKATLCTNLLNEDNNLFLRGGLKLREGFHRKVYNNIVINCTLHAHCWYPNSMDVVTGNIWVVPYAHPVYMPNGAWGKEVDRNCFMNILILMLMRDTRLLFIIIKHTAAQLQTKNSGVRSQESGVRIKTPALNILYNRWYN